MGSNSSRPQPAGGHTPFQVQQQQPYGGQQQQQQQQQQQTTQPYAPPGATNGQYYAGLGPTAMQRPFGMPPVSAGMPAPPQQQLIYSQPMHYPGQYGQPPPRPVATHEYHQTQTIKNQVNLKRHTLKLAPLAGQPHLLGIQFSFDASAPCRVSTFVLTLEEPKRGCKITTGASAPAGRPVQYRKGLDQRFPPADDSAALAAHAINTNVVNTVDLLQQYGDNYPVIIRLEALSDDAAARGHSLEQLAPGDSLPPWVQAQTTYAKLVKQDDGSWGLGVIKQKIWVRGVSYELQEIYGMEQNRIANGMPVAAADDVDGRECVICLSNERDTTVLPCRHMCMCQECASALKTQTNKCPICRNEIESLLHIKIQRKPAGAAAAAAGAGTAGISGAAGAGSSGGGGEVPRAYAQAAPGSSSAAVTSTAAVASSGAAASSREQTV